MSDTPTHCGGCGVVWHESFRRPGRPDWLNVDVACPGCGGRFATWWSCHGAFRYLYFRHRHSNNAIGCTIAGESLEHMDKADDVWCAKCRRGQPAAGVLDVALRAERRGRARVKYRERSRP